VEVEDNRSPANADPVVGSLSQVSADSRADKLSQAIEAFLAANVVFSGRRDFDRSERWRGGDRDRYYRGGRSYFGYYGAPYRSSYTAATIPVTVTARITATRMATLTNGAIGTQTPAAPTTPTTAIRRTVR